MFKKKTDMKKIYLTPEMEIVEINTNQQLLAGSTISTGSTPTDPASSDAPEIQEVLWLFGE